jgi:hypothetical protein
VGRDEMTRVRLFIALLVACVAPASAQLDGPGSTGVSASLIRLFGTNNTFTAQTEVQLLGKDSKELVSTPMTITLLGKQIRLEVDMTRMRNKAQPDALARVKPLGLDSVVSILQPEQRKTVIIFPKLRAFVKLEMPVSEAEAFLNRAKIDRKTIAKEKMEGHPCLKQQVVITDDAGHKSEATVWAATDMRDFPVCVATKESEGTVVMRFRQVQFTRASTNTFIPPAGYVECADMQVLMAGPVTKFMKENDTAVKAGNKIATPKSATTTKKK